MSTPNFLQIKPNGINLPSNAATIVASPGDLAYNSTSNQYAVFNTAADFLLTANGAAGVITGLTNANLSGSAGITNANLASMASQTIKGNITGSSATPSDVALGSITETTSSVLTITGTNTTVGNTTIQVSEATTSTSGYLSSTDWNTFNNKAVAGNYITALNGDIAASGPGVAASSIVATANATLTTLSALTTASSLASVGTITAGIWNATTIAIAHGGTGQVTAAAAFNALNPMTTTGDMIYESATNTAARLPVGTTNQVLAIESGVPTWTNISALPIPQGTKNYLSQYAASFGLGTLNPGNGNWEAGNTTGWALGTIGTLTNGLPTGIPTFGSGASGNLSITAVGSGGQIAGAFSGNLSSSAATTVGNMLHTSAFFIDQEDQAKVLTFKFYYTAASGTSNINFSGTSSNSFGVAVYDATNGVWLPVVGAFSMTQGSGVGIATGTFQTGFTTEIVRFAIYNVTATAGAMQLVIDDITVGPQTAPLGAVITDWVPYSPTFTGFGTVTSFFAFSRRVGDSLEINVQLQAGTPTATPGQVTLGFNGSNGNVVAYGDSISKNVGTIGFGQVGAPSTTNFGSIYVIGPPTNNNFIEFTNSTSTTAFTGTGVNGNALIGAGSFLAFSASVPIVGWSSNVQMSSDTDTRIVDFVGTQTSQSVTANVTNISFTSVADSHGAWSGSTYVIPVSGNYIIGGSIIASGIATPVPYKNGSPVTNWATVASGVAGAGSILIPNCVAGDVLSLRMGSSVTVTGGYLNIYRLSGPSVIAATESVNGRYLGSSSTISGTLANITFTTKDYDTHNAYSPGSLKIPTSGKYQFNVAILVTAASIAANMNAQVNILKNGTLVSSNIFIAGGAVSFIPTNCSDSLSCLAGDAITIQVSSSATTPSIYTPIPTNTYFTWSRVGN